MMSSIVSLPYPSLAWTLTMKMDFMVITVLYIFHYSKSSFFIKLEREFIYLDL